EPGGDVVLVGEVAAVLGERLVERVVDLPGDVVGDEQLAERRVQVVAEAALGPEHGLHVEGGVGRGHRGRVGAEVGGAARVAAAGGQRQSGDGEKAGCREGEKSGSHRRDSRDCRRGSDRPAYSTVTVFARLRGWSTL